jgi:hypothetical protein
VWPPSPERRLLRLGNVAAEFFREQVGDLGVARFLLRAQREEKTQIGLVMLLAEPNLQRRRFGDCAIFAPGSPAPVHARGETLLFAVILGRSVSHGMAFSGSHCLAVATR